MQPILERLHSFQWELCQNCHHSADSALTLTLGVNGPFEWLDHRRHIPVDGCKPFEVDGEDVGRVDVVNAAFRLNQVRALLAWVFVVALKTLDARERLVQERKRVLCKVFETNDWWVQLSVKTFCGKVKIQK